MDGGDFPLALLPVVSFAISALTSTGGVSGAFLLLPFQMSVLGFTSPAVSATNQLYNVVAIPSGVIQFIREGRMVWPLTWVVVIGTLPGVLIGALVRVRYLPDPAHFKVFAGVVLLYIGARLIRDMVRKSASRIDARGAEIRFQELIAAHRRSSQESRSKGEGEIPRVRVRHFSLRRTVYEFYGETFEIPTLRVSLLAFAIGIGGGVYGIGGGAVIAPFLVAWFGLPVYTVAGASLMGTFITSVAGVGFYQAIAPYFPQLVVAPDWRIGLLLGVGGLAGTYTGARLQKHFPARLIKVMLAAIIVGMALRYLLEIAR